MADTTKASIPENDNIHEVPLRVDRSANPFNPPPRGPYARGSHQAFKALQSFPPLAGGPLVNLTGAPKGLRRQVPPGDPWGVPVC